MVAYKTRGMSVQLGGGGLGGGGGRMIGLSLAGMRWVGWGIRLDFPLAGGFWVLGGWGLGGGGGGRV